MQDLSALYETSTWIIPVLLAITLHEAAHGYMAWIYGDNTARDAGRISINPFKHVDRFGTIILPALLLLARSPVLFGYAKPVPVNFKALHPPRVGSLMVAAAGPGTNILMALAAATFLRVPDLPGWVIMNLQNAVVINVALAVFNLLPVLPLDGGRVLAALLPPPLERPFRRMERYGIVLIIALLLLPAVVGMNPLGDYVAAVTRFIVEKIFHVL